MFLGIDTSNYTTSLALVNSNGDLVNQVRKILAVPMSKRGLRQSEALFQHVKNLPLLTQELFSKPPALKGIGVSAKPRPQEDSYMPVFLAGVSLAHSLGNTLAVPVYETTHQENHLLSGLVTANGPRESRFLALHVSGGTTDLLLVEEQAGYRFAIDTIGTSVDLNAGQFIDRIGVALGLPFPAGPHLEELSMTSKERVIIPSHHKQGQVSFSGPLSCAER